MCALRSGLRSILKEIQKQNKMGLFRTDQRHLHSTTNHPIWIPCGECPVSLINYHTSFVRRCITYKNVRFTNYILKLTCSAVIYPTIKGFMNPVVLPMELMVPYIVGAKFGDKSWGFCKFVKVEAPFIPKDIVMRTMDHEISHPTRVWISRSTPGKIWAGKIKKTLVKVELLT